jgi:chromosome partition protein MukF
MLARVDGTGIARAGEYALTRRAATVIECFLADEALSRESLTLVIGTLRDRQRTVTFQTALTGAG